MCTRTKASCATTRRESRYQHSRPRRTCSSTRCGSPSSGCVHARAVHQSWLTLASHGPQRPTSPHLLPSSATHQRALRQVRAGGRIPLIIGRTHTGRARESLGLPPSTGHDRELERTRGAGDANASEPPRLAQCFGRWARSTIRPKGTLAQKMVGRACGKTGVMPGEYCEPRMTTVGSQDTTGPMTRDERRTWLVSASRPTL